ncbi:plasmid partitioning protein RepB [Paracoccus yeei]|uniref:plasmid partitioning protein RepB n=1 Tax=Paracoccus yeei TaxID=147645 RepID=UPI00048D6034|nr:plasmid partitioning protein RepB [Paracoccus yeei]OWJ88842.1 plasmid partitioning protein RepB [Paracoccus yeei]
MRNNILAQSLQKSLEGSKAAAEATPSSPAATADGPRSLRSMADVLSSVSAQAPQEIDPAEIADSEVADRFDVQDGLNDLVESIRASGQQLPVMLRHRRGAGPRYEVVYGRRRIAACRALGIKVIAHIKEMSLDEALMSQALENSARLERSFIEQAVFATKLDEAGFSAERICQALAIDTSTLSRLRTVVRDIPEQLIRGIGAAQGVGRRPWMELRDLIKGATDKTVQKVVAIIPESGSAAERLEAVISALSSGSVHDEPKAQRSRLLPQRTVVAGSVSYQLTTGNMVLRAERKNDRAFLQYVKNHLPQLYSDWVREGEKNS